MNLKIGNISVISNLITSIFNELQQNALQGSHRLQFKNDEVADFAEPLRLKSMASEGLRSAGVL
jgi:hypothetical protein